MTNATPTVMERLKAETQDLHDAAEGHAFQRAMFSGRLSREQYARNLEQLFLVHRDLEARMRSLRNEHPALAAVVKDEQFQEARIREDLAYYGAAPDAARPTPATKRLLGQIETAARERPLALLGHWYVLEGSKNGASFLAKALRKAYDLPEGKGDRHIDPYGPELRAKWQSFKDDMNGVGFSDDEADTLVEGAREMFEAIARIGDDLLEPATA
ncbi:MAG: biliverdin-producing heme oxygenase [Phycisphaerales bacterium]|nr:MAG: biliverdin-producing heme oxygenase [Phycisphaerales bacterium]